MTYEEISATPEWKAFVSKHYNKHRYIDSVSLFMKSGEIDKVMYDGYIFNVKEIKNGM